MNDTLISCFYFVTWEKCIIFKKFSTFKMDLLAEFPFFS